MCAAPVESCARCGALEAAVMNFTATVARVDPDTIRTALTAADFKAAYLGGDDGDVWFRTGFDGVRLPIGFGRQAKNPDGIDRMTRAVRILANATGRHPIVVLADLVVASEWGRW